QVLLLETVDLRGEVRGDALLRAEHARELLLDEQGLLLAAEVLGAVAADLVGSGRLRPGRRRGRQLLDGGHRGLGRVEEGVARTGRVGGLARLRVPARGDGGGRSFGLPGPGALPAVLGASSPRSGGFL